MEDMKVYLFAQALDNDGSDDWYEYTNNSLEEITEENDQSWINNLIFELTDEGKKQNSDKVECYYKIQLTGSFDLVLLIDNDQEDNIGRQSKTALIIKNYKRDSLSFEKILTLFWQKTNRNLSTSKMLAIQCDHIVDVVKKKRKKLRLLVPLTIISLGTILVFFFQKLNKG